MLTLIKGLFLLVLWVLLSAKLDVFHVSLGLLSVILVLFLNRHYPVSGRDWPQFGRLRLGAALYYPFWLLWQIALANIQVAYLVLHPKMPVDPALIKFRADLSSRLSRVVLGNSITLTPGTVTIGLKGRDFLVHALSQPLAESLLLGDLQNRVGHVFRDDKAACPDILFSKESEHDQQIFDPANEEEDEI